MKKDQNYAESDETKLVFMTKVLIAEKPVTLYVPVAAVGWSAATLVSQFRPGDRLSTVVHTNTVFILRFYLSALFQNLPVHLPFPL